MRTDTPKPVIDQIAAPVDEVGAVHNRSSERKTASRLIHRCDIPLKRRIVARVSGNDCLPVVNSAYPAQQLISAAYSLRVGTQVNLALMIQLGDDVVLEQPIIRAASRLNSPARPPTTALRRRVWCALQRPERRPRRKRRRNEGHALVPRARIQRCAEVGIQRPVGALRAGRRRRSAVVVLVTGRERRISATLPCCLSKE